MRKVKTIKYHPNRRGWLQLTAYSKKTTICFCLQGGRLCASACVGLLHCSFVSTLYFCGNSLRFSICYKFTRFKRNVFSLIVSIQACFSWIRLPYFSLKNKAIRPCCETMTYARLCKAFTASSKLQKSDFKDYEKRLGFHLFCHFLSLIFQIFTHGCDCCPLQANVFMGDWEWDYFQCDHCGAGFDQKTVMQPEATETAGMTQPPKERKF